jgi:hypothetical protein
MVDLIQCPKCGFEFEASARAREHMEGELRTQLQAELARRLAEADRLAEQRIRDKDRELEESRSKLASANANEASLLKRQRQVAEREQQLALDLERKLAEETTRIRAQELKAAEDHFTRLAQEQSRTTNQELAAARSKLAESTAREASLLKKQREIEEREQQFTLNLEQKLAEETKRIRGREAKAAEERIARIVAEKVHTSDEELAAARLSLAEATANQAELLKKQRELEGREQQLTVDLERKLLEETKRIRENVEEIAAKRAQLERDNSRLLDEDHKQQLDAWGCPVSC